MHVRIKVTHPAPAATGFSPGSFDLNLIAFYRHAAARGSRAGVHCIASADCKTGAIERVILHLLFEALLGGVCMCCEAWGLTVVLCTLFGYSGCLMIVRVPTIY